LKKIKELTEHPVIAGILLLIIGSISYGAITERLGEFISYNIKWCLIIFYFIIDIFTYKVAIWEIIVFFIILIGILTLYFKIKENSEDTTTVTTTENENLILKILKNNYGKGTLGVHQIATKLNINDIMIIEQIIEGLHFNKKLLAREDNIFDGTTFKLTRLGRDYVLSNKDLFD
jgi:uncharacterized membrane protein